MILKIMVSTKEFQGELFLEDNELIINPVAFENDLMPIKFDWRNINSGKSGFSVKSNMEYYKFDKAYLMNNDGKTIQKYG